MNLHAVDSDRGCRRLGAAALLACAAIAVFGLPMGALPWPWQTALLLPAALMAAWRSSARWPFRRALLATTLQLGACLLAYAEAGPIARPAALAGTILPPLAFVAVRRQTGDAQLGLFLSFCVLLVGTILGPVVPSTLALYVAAAIVQLRCDSRMRALRSCATAPFQPQRSTARAQLVVGLLLAASCLVAALAVERTLAFLPTPNSGPRLQPAAAPAPRHRTGLGDTFDLTGDGGALDLRGDRLVLVAMADGQTVPRGLYLRSGFFQVPGLDSWQVGPLAPQRRDASTADYRLHLPLPGSPVRRLEITRLHDAQKRLFVPPGTCTILGVPDLLGDARREWFRQLPTGRVDVYEVDYQDLPPPPVDLPVDPRWAKAGMLDLPPELDARFFRPLLTEFRPRGSALQKAEAIASGLQVRCRYELREPGGPHDHALLNFLHGERIGFCMHFASAAAILLRMSGVPCRIGVGLYGGLPAARGQREFGSQHSHAWVEIPITGRGWVTFDPTPPALRGTRTDLSAAAAAMPDGDAGVAEPSLLDTLLVVLRGWMTTVWPYLGLLALLLVPFGHRRGEGRLTPAVARSVRPARRWLLRIQKALAERGHRRQHGTTIEQLADALRRAGACPPDLHAAFAAYQDVRFGGRPWDSDRERCMARGLAAAAALPKPAAPATGG